MNQSKQDFNNWLLVLAVFALAFAPLILVRNTDFGGADDKAKTAISQIQPAYQPWFQSIFEPPSGEVASLLFSAQAAIGAGVIGYAIGLYKGRSQQQKHEE
ncbi:MAG: energy-coupling factor ABC transporter substrate-binding protein [Sphaerospermopsis kisseleviana]